MWELIPIILCVIGLIIGSIGWFVRVRGKKKLHEAGATSPEKAVKPEEIGMTRGERIALDLSGAAKSTKDGRLYIPCKNECKT